jgi:hypothetical protein
MVAEPAPAGGRLRTRWLLAGAVLGGTIAIGLWVQGSDRQGESAQPECPDLEDLAGRWSFTTEVVGARAPDKLDLQGFYELVVEREGCSATAKMTKHGFTGHDFGDARKQHAEATLHAGAPFGHGAVFELRDGSGRGPDQEFVFTVRAGRLSGVWRQRGSRWEKSGLHGFLGGEAEAAAPPRTLDVAAQPCDVRCVLACDGLRREDDALASAIDACRSACALAGAEVVACGDRRPLPETLQLRLEGPEPSYEALCGELPCRLDPKLGRRHAASVTSNPIDAARVELHLVELGDDAIRQHRLALRTQDGWFVSPPLDGTDDTGVHDLRLHERAIGHGDRRRVVFGTFRTSPKGPRSTFVCRPDEPTPRCVLVPAGFEPAPGRPARRVDPLPEDTLAVAVDDGDVVLFGW